MKDAIHLPKFQADAFDCPRCGAYAHMAWANVAPQYNGFPNLGIKAAACAKCAGVSIWEITEHDTTGQPSNARLVLPEAIEGPMPHPDMPPDCSKDYEEARKIFPYSPRASAALLRLSVQKLCKHLGEPGSNINTDIKSLVAKGLPVMVQQSLDAIRVTGNNAVHPGVMSEEDTRELTSNLFGLINYIIDNQISQPKHLAAIYNKLPESARDAILSRDSVKMTSKP